MTAVALNARRGRRLLGVSRALVRIGWLNTIAYPMAFFINQFAELLPVITFAFVEELVGGQKGQLVGGDYYTFAVIGLFCIRLTGAGMTDFASYVSGIVSNGQMEMLLVEPIHWKLLPYALAQWVIAQRALATVAVVFVSIALGAHYDASGWPAAIGILILGIGANMSIGIAAVSIRILAKRSDPVIVLYQLSALIFAGATFPVALLPDAIRWIRWLLPHTYVIDAVRHVLMPAADQLPSVSLRTCVFALVAVNVVGHPLALWLYGRMLEQGRKLGVLSGY
jgi:ABC-2 type transport system permease protein